MSKRVKSMKGEIVDFDVLKIKQQIAASPAPIEVSERKSFIDNKLQRRIRRAKDSIQNAKDNVKKLEIDVKEEPIKKPTRKVKK